MTETTETFNSETVTSLNRRVIRIDGLYYVQRFKHTIFNGSLVFAGGEWQRETKGYVHSTSAFAALGRLVQKNNVFKNL